MKIIRYLSFLLIFIFSYEISLGCDCSPRVLQNVYKQMAYEKSKIVFLGKVQSINEKSTTFDIIEILKGEHKNDSIIVTNSNSCALYPEKNEMWLIYIEVSEKENEYYTSICLPNRNYGLIDPLMDVLSPKISNISIFKRQNHILSEIELNSLRQKKILKKIENLNDRTSILTYSILGVLIMLILYKILKKRPKYSNS